MGVVLPAGILGFAGLALPCTFMLATSITPWLCCFWVFRLKALQLFPGTTARLEEKLTHVEKYEMVTPREVPAPRGKRDLSAAPVSSVISQTLAWCSRPCCLAEGPGRGLQSTETLGLPLGLELDPLSPVPEE